MVSDAIVAKENGADVVEIRLDQLWTKEDRSLKIKEPSDDDSNTSETKVTVIGFDEVDIESEFTILEKCTDLPIIFCCRPDNQGGFFPGSEEQRIDLLKMAISLSPGWIDLEADIDEPIRSELISMAGEKTKVITSIHNDGDIPAPSEISQEILDMQEMGDVVKVCYATKNRTDGLRIFEAAWNLKETEAKVALMGLGPGGDWARIHAPILGQYLVYSTTESGWHLAQQGRINTSDLRTAWSIMEYA